MEPSFLIWSHGRKAWWGQGRRGYTESAAEAGRYTLAEAKDVCHDAARFTAGGFVKEPENSIVPSLESYAVAEAKAVEPLRIDDEPFDPMAPMTVASMAGNL